MISDCYQFTTCFPFIESTYVTLANGKSSAYGKGTVHLSKDLILKDVLLVPSFPSSSLSAHKLCSQNCHVLFTSTSCIF